MNGKTRIAVIGCGFFAQNHLYAWKDLGDQGAELVAVCDTDANKAHAAAATFGTKAYTDLASMLDQAKPELVEVVTRMDTHLAIFAEVAKRGISSSVQKPLAPNWNECIAMAELAKHHSVSLAIHENFRFQQPIMQLKTLVVDGVIGTPSWARIAFRTGYDVYANQPYFYNEERLAILDVGTHVLDVARLFMGEATRISCETQKRNRKVQAEDTAAMLLRHETGAVSEVECTYEARRFPDPFPHTHIEIEGDKGVLICKSPDCIMLSDGTSSRKIEVSNIASRWMEKPWHVVQASVLNTNAHVLKRFRACTRAATDITDNLKTFALVEAAYAAAHSHRAEVPQNWRG